MFFQMLDSGSMCSEILDKLYEQFYEIRSIFEGYIYKGGLAK